MVDVNKWAASSGKQLVYSRKAGVAFMAFDSAHGDYVLLILLLIVIRKGLQKYSQMVVVQSSACSTEQAQNHHGLV